ncbi:MAG: UDP-N-acetylmuramate dehydrogenase [Tissierella sp.]|uniref:UDP-N-acetylmuramate dehydrogenase n=1 Tax=Tissierella sp. TaxID=41274 RepID=UPI003F953C78
MDKKRLIQIFEDKNVGSVLIDEPMKNHTSFKIGGPVDIMILPRTEDEVKLAMKLCKENKLQFMIMGNGSNLLIKDGGIRGVIIKLNENFNKVEVKDDRIYAQSGALLNAISRIALENSLSGFEFATGIPGALGGAMTMNAGAYGGEMKDVVESVRVLDENGDIKEYSNEEMNFRYRGSRVSDEGLTVLTIVFKLKHGKHEDIKAIIDDLTHKRTSKQPLEYPSGGSTFKRPVGYYAGKLIDDSGLRGLRYGGAEVSKKHCGFVINIEEATCKDVLTLIDIVKKTVKDNFGVELEREIKLLGEEL